ncbi:MAG TPA: prolyl oligopeptidase family serine peptidase [Thermoanaerobaculia bacterium]|nr:prolyl oligopeptidase family serine peptidase [Thermoanaerobaculia bacterium]
MEINSRRTVLSLLTTLLLAVPAARAAETAPRTLPVPESISAQGVPPIPTKNVEDLLPYENIRAGLLSDWHPTERRLLIRTRFSESPQIHEVAMPMGARTQLTFYRDPAGNGLYRPGNPDQIVYSLNEGGAENFQFFLLDRKTGRARRFTDGTHRYTSPVWSRDGKLLAYASNARNGRDMDVYVADPATPGSERRIAEVQGAWEPLDWSADNRRVLLDEFISANESYLHWVDAAGGEIHTITPRNARKEGPTVSYQGGRWSKDGRSVYTSSDQDSEFLRLVRLDPATGAAAVLSGNIPWDVEQFDLSDDGRLVAFFTDEDGVSRLHLLDAATGAPLPSPELPAGVAGNLLFRRGSHEVGFDLSSARSPSDVYSYDPDTRRVERWTASETGGLNLEVFPQPELIHYPTFDTVSKNGPRRMIPAFVYKPDPGRFKGRRPVYVSIHGGPESQARPLFLGSMNYLLDELGVAIVYPNVRGSAGYGKSYLKLDNGRLREDSVKDIGALLDWIATQPDLDPKRVMVAGGSYGGYMSLAVMTHYSDRLACGWDTVGISNFVTFLEHTQGYRQDLRRAEYGDERDPGMRAFLEGIAPVNHAKQITRPLLVSQGANDPRVPLAESDQIAAAVKSNGVPVWYLVAKDEGHGFGKKTNTDYQRAVLFEFVRRYLIGEK